MKIDKAVFNSKIINEYITYEIKSWPFYTGNGFTFNYLQILHFKFIIWRVKLKLEIPIWISILLILDTLFNSMELPNGGFGEILIILGAHMSSSVHVDNEK